MIASVTGQVERALLQETLSYTNTQITSENVTDINVNGRTLRLILGYKVLSIS